MSINPLGDDSRLPFSDEIKEKEVGSLGGHAVSKNPEDKENLEEDIEQAAANIGSESEKLGQLPEHHIVGVDKQGSSPKHVLGPNGDLYSVVTKKNEGEDIQKLFSQVNEELRKRFANSKHGPNDLELVEIAAEGFGETVSSISASLSEIRETIENSSEKTGVDADKSCCRRLIDFLQKVLSGIRKLYMSFLNKARSTFKSRKVEEEVNGLEEKITGLEKSLNKANLSDEKAENILSKFLTQIKLGIAEFLNFFRLLFDKTQTGSKEKGIPENPYSSVSVHGRSSSSPREQEVLTPQEALLQELKDKLGQRS